MQQRKKPYRIGDIVKTKNCGEFYSLPHGLPEGAEVKVIGLNASQDDVIYTKTGQYFQISMACIDSGWEYLVDGKWQDQPPTA